MPWMGPLIATSCSLLGWDRGGGEGRFGAREQLLKFHATNRGNTPLPLEQGSKSKAHHPKSCKELGPIHDFSKSRWVEPTSCQSALTPSMLHEAVNGMN